MTDVIASSASKRASSVFTEELLRLCEEDATSTSEVDNEAASDTCAPEMANDGRPGMSRKVAVALVVDAREIGSVIVQDLSPFGASRA